MAGMNPYTGKPPKPRTIEDCMREIRRMSKKDAEITRLTAENAALRELLNTAREQLLNVDDDPFEPYPERDRLIDDIRAAIDDAGKGE